MIFNFKPRDPEEFEDMDVVKLAAQVDVLQTVLVTVITSLGGRPLGRSLVSFLDNDMEVTASVERHEDGTDESFAEAQCIADRYLEGIAMTRDKIRRAIESAKGV